MTKEEILQRLPYTPPFLFVDALEYIDEEKVIGSYTFDAQMPCYKGHFSDYPVTPGVLLTEVMAQTGLVCLGIYLLRDTLTAHTPRVAMTATYIDFYLSVFPGETVTVHAEKVYFRFGKLKCSVVLKNASGEDICGGTIEGMIINKPNE
ncbi:3-hydroxyacyl-[acyl-carrier-protein] dehydratase [Chitinophaga niastensis]|uniref:3-hydroxyacyl-[acyl-carrier-protein] dehydratase n=1 Tax=Chitinophaga niastensis TaxID=536980 RepID=A0A2P8HGJ1_CHINA|nr:beta-hydroxyacyl-ACP dehydratase [Chitinophaga niastensis]PSL45320.1 3-hydroxyacyl-[acyl-carrier-protein] dehydratase [Chitinophaga niastensis]